MLQLLSTALTSTAREIAFVPVRKEPSPHLNLHMPPLTPLHSNRGEVSRRSYLLPNQEHRRQQQALSHYPLATVLPDSNTPDGKGEPI